MRLIAALALSTVASGQMPEGDLLIASAFGEWLRHYAADGTLVADEIPGPRIGWSGATITDTGRWISGYYWPTAGLSIYEGTGVEHLSFHTPQTGGVLEVELFVDGTIAVLDSTTTTDIDLYSQQGAYLGTIATSLSTSAAFTILGNDIWVCESTTASLRHFDRAGTDLGSIPLGTVAATDVDWGPAGTLWVLLLFGDVRQYATDGTLLSSFDTGLGFGQRSIAVALDGSIWIASGPDMLRYGANGRLQSSFQVVPTADSIDVSKSRLGSKYCSPALPNSSGAPGVISVSGSAAVDANDLTLRATDLPAGEFGYFLVGSSQGQMTPPGSQGVLCLACSGSPGCTGIGRFSRPGMIVLGPTGSLTLDLTFLPLSPPVMVQPGDVWNFQCWYRDLGSSNFTDAVSVLFY
ncbi:MAG: hypothetical protein GY711_17315 [bacterium]|nr:hypothetical protein [bacterium]